MATARQANLPVVDDATAKTFDDYVAASAKVQAASKHDKKRKETHKTLLAKFDELQVDRFALPDGRVVQRTEEGRDMPAKKAHRQSWWKIFLASE